MGMSEWLAAVRDPEYIQEGLWWMLGVLALSWLVVRSKLWGRPPNPAGMPCDGGNPFRTPPTPTDESIQELGCQLVQGSGTRPSDQVVDIELQ